jgi:hypothetical protein
MMIGYPTNRLLAVFDDPSQAHEAVADLQRRGVQASDLTLLQGPEGIEQLRNLGTSPTGLRRVTRMVQYMTMDQMPDFVMYEAALRDGRALLAVRATGKGRLETARDVVLGHGAHFLNWFGRLATAEISQWRGPEPDIPGYLKR